MRGSARAEFHDLRPREALAHHGQHFGEAEGADQHRDQPEAAGEVGVAEAEALVGVHALLPDAGDEQAEEAGEPALERIGRDHVAGHHDAEQREPEELEGAELSAISPSIGVNSARQMRPNSVPTTEPVVAMPMARPAWPCRAS